MTGNDWYVIIYVLISDLLNKYICVDVGLNKLITDDCDNVGQNDWATDVELMYSIYVNSFERRLDRLEPKD